MGNSFVALMMRLISFAHNVLSSMAIIEAKKRLLVNLVIS